MSIEHRMHQFQDKTTVVVCPPYIFLPALSHYVHFLKLGAQNSSWEQTGPFTGEVSPAQLAEFGVQYAVVGHSERRLNFGETDGAVMLKIFELLKEKITPVVCLGGEKGATRVGMKRLVARQFKNCLSGIDKKDWQKIILVYEPSWAISTGKNATPATADHAEELITYIRSLLAKTLGQRAALNSKVLYGGSVNGGNASQFATCGSIDGALVGAASLDADNFTEVVREFARAAVGSRN